MYSTYPTDLCTSVTGMYNNFTTSHLKKMKLVCLTCSLDHFSTHTSKSKIKQRRQTETI